MREETTPPWLASAMARAMCVIDVVRSAMHGQVHHVATGALWLITDEQLKCSEEGAESPAQKEGAQLLRKWVEEARALWNRAQAEQAKIGSN